MIAFENTDSGALACQQEIAGVAYSLALPRQFRLRRRASPPWPRSRNERGDQRTSKQRGATLNGSACPFHFQPPALAS